MWKAGMVEEGRVERRTRTVCKCIIQRERLLQACGFISSCSYWQEYSGGNCLFSCMLTCYWLEVQGTYSSVEEWKRKSSMYYTISAGETYVYHVRILLLQWRDRKFTLHAFCFSNLTEIDLAVVDKCFALFHKVVLKFPHLIVHVPSLKIALDLCGY